MNDEGILPGRKILKKSLALCGINYFICIIVCRKPVYILIMKKVLTIIFISLVGVALIAFLISKFSVNQNDPEYFETKDLLAEGNITTIGDTLILLETLFDSIQKDPSLHHKNLAEKILKDPFTPTTDYKDYLKDLRYIYTNKIVAIDGVSGAGKSTFCDRAALQIAGDKSRLQKVKCTPKTEVEMNKQWIGEYDKGTFYPGKLLKFIEKCRKDSLHNYVLYVEDLDKINPITFFGADIWNELDNSKYTNAIEGYSDDFNFPSNFYIISVFTSGVGATNDFSLEQIRRLSHGGTPLEFAPNEKELYLYLKGKYRLPNCSRDTLDHLLKVMYFFVKANEYIASKYDKSYCVGQWSGVQKLSDPGKFDDYVNAFVNQVNSFKPLNPIKREDFDDIFYTLKHKGKVPKTNQLYLLFQGMLSTGLFSEFSVGILFAICAAVYGWILYQRKRKFIHRLLVKYESFINQIETKEISYETAKENLADMLKVTEKLLIKNKIGFPEANYLISINQSYSERIEHIRNIDKHTKEFQCMIDHFMKDGVLQKEEYEKLISYLDNIREDLTQDEYSSFRHQIDDLFSG